VDTLFERWCESRLGWRVLGWCLGVVMLSVMLWTTLLRPVQKQRTALQLQLARTERFNASLWPAASKVLPPAITPVRLAVQPFSPLDFQSSDARLVQWKPLSSGGELTLDADWQAVPAVFSRLAQRNAQVMAFSLTPQGAKLRLRVQLEQDHAQ
jgi:pilus assembly protein HofO